ncbi:MAG: diguanylate cyclase [Thermoleophilia bacterium]|nr:diguanylate cyclase [Thermoleophilia bacterium]
MASETRAAAHGSRAWAGPGAVARGLAPGRLGALTLTPVRGPGGRVEDMRVEACSAAAGRLLARPATALLGRRLGAEFAGQRDDGVLAALGDVLAAGEPWRGSLRFGATWLEVLAVPVGEVLVLSLWAPAPHAFREAEPAPAAGLEAEVAEQAALRRIATAAARHSDPAAVVATAAAEWLALRPLAGLALVRMGDGGRGLALVPGWVGPRAAELGRTRRATGADVAMARALAEGRTVRVDDAAHGRFPMGLAVPLWVRGRLWGALCAAAERGRGFADADTAMLEGCADLVAMALAQEEVRTELSAAARTDHLTGLPNRRAFTERLGGEVRLAARHGHPLALAVLDLDLFKLVNDTHGHTAGDEVLVEVAARLAAAGRAGELVARIGGEEFGWILPRCDADGALAAVERARAGVAARPVPPAGRVTLSAGIAVLGPGSGEDLFWRADGALYQAKAAGRDRAVVAVDQVPAQHSSG